MRHAPFFIELPNGDLLNVDQITYVSSSGSGCIIHLAVPQINGTFSGNAQMGGSGSQSGSIYSNSEYIACALSRAEFLALINKEVALVHAMENTAQ